MTEARLTFEQVQQSVRARGIAHCRVEVFDSLPSTSAYLSAMPAQHDNAFDVSGGTCQPVDADIPMHLCATDWQTHGVGRRGKRWDTSRGNVTFSVLLSLPNRPAELMGLSLVTGICVAESLTELANIHVQLKWPNDVLVEGNKLCGLLTELRSGASQTTQVIAGIGVNYTKQAVVTEGDYQSTSLPLVSDAAPQRAELIADICARIGEAYQLFSTGGWSLFADRWRRYDYLSGRKIRVIHGNNTENAVAIGVNDDGALLIDRNGVRSTVYSGDVSVRAAS